MEELKIKYGLGSEIPNICTEICRAYRRAKIPETQISDVYRAFDKEGYQIYTNRVVFGKSLAIAGNLPEENIIRFNQVREFFTSVINEDYRHFTREQNQELFFLSQKFYDKETTVCEENNIPTVTSGNAAHQFYQMQSDNEKYRNKIETPSPKYEWTELSVEVKAFAADLLVLAEQMAQFPPQIKSQAHKLALGFRAFRTFFNPGLDRKHKRHWADWIENVQTTIDTSINGTATTHPTESNLCDKCVQPDLDQDPKGTWKLMKPVAMTCVELTDSVLHFKPDSKDEEQVKKANAEMKAFKIKFMSEHGLDPENEKHQTRMGKIIEDGYAWVCPKCKGVYGREIIVSREHTSDMIRPTLDLVRDLINHFPPFISFCKWYSDWREKYLDAQTISLSPKLKEKKSG